ncbi:MAG: DUF6034 family protein [Eubacteriales bacterium]|nr:DUF6034 family protein [Eubacteriales bacterium]
MKRIIAMLIAAVICTALLGCQATPENPVVIQKDMEQMIEKGMAESDTSSAIQNIKDYSGLCAYYGVPERFQTNISEGKLTISCDVAIELPETTALPMARVEAGGFTQEQVYAFFIALCGDTQMYILPEQPDKEYYQQQILEQQAELAVETDENLKVALNSTIAFLQEEYKKAPDHNELVLTDGTLQTEEMRENNIKESLGNYTVLRATSAPFEENAETFYIFNDVENATGIYSGKDEQGNTFTLAPRSCAALRFNREGMDTNYSSYWQGQILSDVTEASLSGGASADCDLSTTPQQARGQVESFLNDRGLGDMVIDTVSLCSNQKSEYMSAAEGGYSVVSGSASDEPVRQAYVFRILRRQGGVKVESTHEMSQTTLEMAEGDGDIAVGKEWSYEYMTIAVDDGGIANVYWQGPLKVTEVLTENTAIRPWNEIASVFEKMIIIKNAMYEDIDTYASVTIDITHVSLSLQRVMERDSYTTGLLVPVWNFYGTTTYVQTDGNPLVLQCGYTPLISINAIDGSVIDLSQGY